LSRFDRQLVWIGLLLAISCSQIAAQTSSLQPAAFQLDRADSNGTSVVKNVRLVHEQGVPAIEVRSTRPLVPAIRSLASPARMVIDLPNATLGFPPRRVAIKQEGILSIRTEQFQDVPPITRIVVDLLSPFDYTWDASGNRLMVRLAPAAETKSAKKSSTPVPAAPTLASPNVPPVVPASAGPGWVTTSGGRVAAGSSVTAGSDAAVLHLSRGGEVRVCPGTTLSVTPSKTAHELMLGMSTGALEAHYSLDSSADSVLTPDFRILFAGPGEFHYAISADSRGNTCVRALMGNTSSAIVSELMGDRIYQVKPSQQAVFREGRIDRVDADVPLECGCPPVVPPLQTALPATPELGFSQKSSVAGTSDTERSSSQDTTPLSSTSPQATLSNGPETAPLPPTQPDDIHVQVEAPFVFSAKNRPLSPGVQAVKDLPVEDSSTRHVRLEAVVQPPPAPPPETAQKHGILKRIKGFFAALFR
jgi:hypothetical protein